MKKHYLAAALGGLFALSAVPAMAFHDGGVAHCDGCHSMHASAENPISGDPNEALLKGSDATSTCLNCHSDEGAGGTGGYHVVSADGSYMKEGGDFGWLQLQYGPGGTAAPNTAGDNAGHNVVSIDYGLTPDAQDAPGATVAYSAALLGCTSCHDAHGQVNGGTKGGSLPVSVSGSYAAEPDDNTTIKGNFRLLGDSAYKAGGSTDQRQFANDAPIALTNGSDGKQTRYGSGMSEWCANCHDAYLNKLPNSASGKHPTSVLLSTTGIDANYNGYVATGNFTGAQTSSYNDMVPFETGTDQAALIAATVTSNDGPVVGGTAQVMCLSCHRAHASAFNNSGRWDFKASLIAEGAAVKAGTTVSATGKAYYADGAPVDVVAKYGVEQRSLCNKCHVQD